MKSRRIILPIILIITLFIAVGVIDSNSPLKPKPPEVVNNTDADRQDENINTAEDEQSNTRRSLLDAERKDNFYTFLVFGLDNGINTDTIMVLSYDYNKKTADLISIPRDSLVNVERRIKKINGAYPTGTLNGGGRQGGVDQLKRELSAIIGFAPDHHIAINTRGFERIINAVGGVEINVPFHMKYEDPEQDLHIDLMPGKYLLNGEQALLFARYRLAAPGYQSITDFQRIENQQAVISSLLERLLRPANILKIPEFIRIFSENVFTDLEYSNLIWFAGEFNSISGSEALSEYTLPITGTSGLPNYYEYLDGPAIVELVNMTINPYTVDIELEDLDIISEEDI